MTDPDADACAPADSPSSEHAPTLADEQGTLSEGTLFIENTPAIEQGAPHQGTLLPPGDREINPAASHHDEVAALVARSLEAAGQAPAAAGNRVEKVPVAAYLSAFAEEIPARMLNEFVYCPRLFYYEFVEGVFLHNEHTLNGSAAHARVDRAKPGALPAAKRAAARKKAKSAAEGGSDDEAAASGAEEVENEVIHSRSVSLGSDRLGVTAKLDLVEIRGESVVCPVEYKAGSPRLDAEGAPAIWDTDRMQLGLQMLILRENGYECAAGVIYYRGTRQRVRLDYSEELEQWIQARVIEARVCAAQKDIPPPLIDSPKCQGCSLAPVCLPDETRLLMEGAPLTDEPSPMPDRPTPAGKLPRRLAARRDVKRAVYLSTPGVHVGISGSSLRCSLDGKVIEEIPLNDVLHLGLFGNVGVTTPAARELLSREIPISWFSTGGWFYGLMRGHNLTNVMTRIEQFAAAARPETCLALAKEFVRGKIRNCRVMLMRNHVEPPAGAIGRLKRAIDFDVDRASSLPELLGVEGVAASFYFQQFQGMIKPRRPDGRAGEEEPGEKDEDFAFDFHGRNRRPPRDAVNALLSLSYSLLTRECAMAAHVVGFDPYVGFYHQPRHGRPALALDMMEEFRPLVADSAVLQAINNGIISPSDFVRAGSSVNLTPAGRKKFFQVWERRIASTVTHPVFAYEVSYRRAIELQFRLLARVLTREIERYPPFVTR